MNQNWIQNFENNCFARWLLWVFYKSNSTLWNTVTKYYLKIWMCRLPLYRINLLSAVVPHSISAQNLKIKNIAEKIWCLLLSVTMRKYICHWFWPKFSNQGRLFSDLNFISQHFSVLTVFCCQITIPFCRHLALSEVHNLLSFLQVCKPMFHNLCHCTFTI